MNSSLLLSRLSSKIVPSLMLGLGCLMLTGCMSLGQKELVPPDHVRLVHSEQHCNDVDKTNASPFPNAVHIESAVLGKSVFLSLSGSEWEWTARQLAVERDADLSLIRPCDGEGAFKYAQIEVWRTLGFIPPMFLDEPRPESGTLTPPPQTSYGTRLLDIFECFEKARVSSGPITHEDKQKLGDVDATEFFKSGNNFLRSSSLFIGYARIDRYYRPTRTGELSLASLQLDRPKADWAAWIYEKLSPEEKTPFAEHYLICLLDRGYSL